ncbi:pentatricopeptide repeat-containing protein [Pyrus ussuriensis x Pyrus communis]|uniref:Pentatricopeptide repeat-containing protein n=1 Tax=Pyrus ussuriensis x Pyrus communis TaxID=2448454 RepID=A0A5N5I2G2_9ROSA|nr:pentatricopeptide repeat-containing protein [Pyrus ussuriensis x Pyrus communis]
MLRGVGRALGDIGSGEWIDGYITEIGMGMNVFVATSSVDMYTKCGNTEKTHRVFDVMPEKDIVSWSSMIQGYASKGLPKEAIDLFFQMQEENLKPNCYAMVGVLSTSLIDMYAKCGNMVLAWAVFKGSVLRQHGHESVNFFLELEGLDLESWSQSLSNDAVDRRIWVTMSNEAVVVQPPWLMSVMEESGSSPLINDAKQPSHHERLKLQAEREEIHKETENRGLGKGEAKRKGS